jgi:hypothetical protein
MTTRPSRRWRATSSLVIATAALLALAAGCAPLSNTPAQDLAWNRWTLCHPQATGTQIRIVRSDGRISFWYTGPEDRRAMVDCIRLAAKDGPALPEPIADLQECSGTGGGM